MPRYVLGTHVAAASGYLVEEQWYIDTPSGYQSIGGASTLGPCSSYSEAQSVNNQYFHGRGDVYQKSADMESSCIRQFKCPAVGVKLCNYLRAIMLSKSASIASIAAN